ncbi:MAG: calcium/sodium antiporter [Hyphomicrobiaceae bacterium]
MTDIAILLAGFALLIAGGEILVRGSVRVAQLAGMSPLVIGITLVGFGTSAPELVTSIQASLAGSPGIAVGNVVGSNIANILLILGVAALLSPMTVSKQAYRRDGTTVALAALLFNLVGYFLTLNRWVGAAFLAMLASYIWLAYRQERTAPEEGEPAPVSMAAAVEGVEPEPLIAGADRLRREGVVLPLLAALAGLAIIVAGGKLLVDGATSLARAWGISETIIGLTIVAVGTSMPELVTSAVAALRKQSDVALGNVMGSCVYNLLGIAGTTGLIAPTIVPPEIVSFDNLVMLAASLMMLVFARSALRISRMEGALLLASYCLYLFWIWPA